MNKKVAVVILNWNGRKKGLLEKYLPSVVEYSSNALVVVADNGSEDDSIVFVKDNFPTVRIIALDKNYGFTGGYNRALQELEADYFILLNDDVEVTPDWINPVIEQMEKNETIAIAQPKLLSFRNKTLFEYAGAAGGYLDYLGYPFCAGRIFDNLEQDTGQYDKEREIFWASGASMFVKSKVFKQLQGLDEDFFAHMEEIDFCWRAKNQGYKVMYYPQSKVYHYGAATLNTSSPQKTFLNFRNNLFLLCKNLPDNKIKSVMRKRFLFDLLAGVIFLLQGKTADCKAVFKARQSYRTQKQKFLSKRPATINTYPSKTLKKSIVIESKLFHKKTFSQITNI